MTSKPIGVGLVGFGMSGRVLHGPLLTANPQFDLRVVADPLAEDVHRRLPGVRLVPDLAGVLRDDAVELVIVATPNRTHARLAERALRAGRHVVLEKPMTPTTADAERLITAADAAGRTLSVFHCRRWDDDFRLVCDVISGGRLGTVHRYLARFEFYARRVPGDWRREPGPGSGLLFDVGSHLIDQALVLFGWPMGVTARLGADAGHPDHAFTVALDLGPLEVLLLGSERTLLASPTFEVHGDGGSLIVDGGRDGQETVLAAGSPADAAVPRRSPSRLVIRTGAAVEIEHIERPRTSYQAFYDRLARTIRLGEPSPVGAHEGRDVIAVIDAARRSERSGRTIRLDR